MACETLLLIDDDIELCNLLTEYLTDESLQVEACHNGLEGVAKVSAGHYALVILDVMLPGCSGFEALQKIRKQSDVPVLMLTARGDEVDRIVGLEIGADDYLAKPFNPRELIARIRAILRRTRGNETVCSPAADKKRITVGDLEMDISARRVTQAGRVIDLTAVEFTLLKILVLSAGQVVSRETLNQAVLGRDYSPLDRSIDVHISKLRKKLRAEADASEVIKSVRGEGYVYAA
ncbi:MAG: response regulator transcription factor [Desulfobacteraceae bacterium]|nr:response regulator transcription factor [Desulfobacteraceae bacterium]